HQRAARGVCQQSCFSAQGDWGTRRGRCTQREDERQDPRACHAESTLPAGGWGQRGGGGQGERAHARQRENRRHARARVRGEDPETDRTEKPGPIAAHAETAAWAVRSPSSTALAPHAATAQGAVPTQTLAVPLSPCIPSPSDC